MGKAEDLKRNLGGNIKESIGAGGARPALARPNLPTREPVRREVGTSRALNVFQINLAQLVADPDQPRKEFDPEELDRLAQSLRRNGQLQPISARWSEEAGLWVIVSGERRFRAAGLAGLAHLQVVEVRSHDASHLRSHQMVENLLRVGLRPIEEALGFRELMTLNGWTTTKLAEELSISQGKVSQALALLDLAEPVRVRVEEGTLSAATAYEVSKVKDEATQERIVEQALAEQWTRNEVREIVHEAKAEARVRADAESPTPPEPRARKPAARPARPLQAWKGKVDGYSITIDRKRGFDPTGAAEALRQAAHQIEADALATAS